MSEPLEALRRIVFERPELRDELLAETDDVLFAALVRRKAAELGVPLDENEVEAAIGDGRRAWHQRRI